MTFLGEENKLYETIIFIILSGICFLLVLIQVIYLQKLKGNSVRMLPVLTLAICYESACNGAGDTMSNDSGFAKFSVSVLAIILPMFIVILFELPFRLHEARSAHFMCIPFEQGEALSNTIASISLYSVRTVALGIFVVNLLVNLDLLHDENNRAGLGGYATAENELNSVHFWLSIVPSMVLAALSLYISILMQRYARNFTLGIRNSNHYWRYMLPCSVLYTVGQCFGAHIYRWTSLAGDVFLVIGITIMVQRVQSDLSVAGSFADFLHRSNAVFRSSQQQPHDPKKHKVVTPVVRREEYKSPADISLEDVHLENIENGEKGNLPTINSNNTSLVKTESAQLDSEVEIHAL